MLYDYRYQSKDLIVMIDDENNLVLVGLLHVFLDRLFLHVVQFHDRIFHQQNQIERVEVEMIENVVVFVKFHFLYSIEKYNKYLYEIKSLSILMQVVECRIQAVRRYDVLLVYYLIFLRFVYD